MLLFDSYGKPARDTTPVIQGILSRKPVYHLVDPEKVENYSEYSFKIGYCSMDVKSIPIDSTDPPLRAVVIHNEKILVSSSAPERFRPILAYHEIGHAEGLDHREIFVLEMMAADMVGEETKDRDLKLDYLKWATSDDMLNRLKRNLGTEELQNQQMLPEIYGKEDMKRSNANAVFKQVNGELVRIC